MRSLLLSCGVWSGVAMTTVRSNQSKRARRNSKRLDGHRQAGRQAGRQTVNASPHYRDQRAGSNDFEIFSRMNLAGTLVFVECRSPFCEDENSQRTRPASAEPGALSERTIAWCSCLRLFVVRATSRNYSYVCWRLAQRLLLAVLRTVVMAAVLTVESAAFSRSPTPISSSVRLYTTLSTLLSLCVALSSSSSYR
jgi:hypothetical protein